MNRFFYFHTPFFSPEMSEIGFCCKNIFRYQPLTVSLFMIGCFVINRSVISCSLCLQSLYYYALLSATTLISNPVCDFRREHLFIVAGGLDPKQTWACYYTEGAQFRIVCVCVCRYISVCTLNCVY
ncbi:hypothetical protein CDAR_286581 [Caerostris darwini]|uniref:Uncharacterized protein n=1 Tax=Caerostris darwini TaxID=1538125 RepID=A0AAV4UV32_9ARAC|nr:hypothetical protein CDAR_286581 [Caerostris darwini]